MGTFYVDCKVENYKDPKRAAVVPKLLVDCGSESTWIPADILQRIGISRVKKDISIQMANGQIITRSVGYAVLRVEKFETIDEVVFAQQGDLALLGSRALEGMNVHVDARRKRLVAAGPVVAATAIRSATAKALGIIVPGKRTKGSRRTKPSARRKTKLPARRKRPAKRGSF